MHRPEDCAVFEYSEEDFELRTNRWMKDSEFELSKFDLELRGKWANAMKAGAFRYNIDHIITRIIPGPKHYVAQLNELRAKERRAPQDIRCIKQPFNPKQFNFTWVGPQEVVFNLKRVHNTQANSTPHIPDSERHTLIINVSPMEFGHCLLVPEIDTCRPQIITETSLTVALEMVLLSKHRGFNVGFNSLCAFASVNHLHFHAYYLEQRLIVEYCPVLQLAGELHQVSAVPVPGFAFQLAGSSIHALSRNVHKVSNYLHEADIAHNLFMCRGVEFGETADSSNTTIRVFIWPRRKYIGTKSSEEFNVACIELGGHLPIKELDGYHNLTEEAVDDILEESSLPEEQFQCIKQNVIALFSPQFNGASSNI